MLSVLGFLEKFPQRILLIVILTTGCIGFVYCKFLGDHITYWDEKQYLKLAKNLADHLTFGYREGGATTFRAPGYPFFLSFFVFFGMQIEGLRLINFLLYLFNGYLIYCLGHRKHPLTASLSILLFFVYPILFYTATLFYPQTLGMTLLLLVLYFYWVPNTLLRHYLVGGLFMGSLILTIPIFVFICAVMTIWALCIRKNLLGGLAFLAAACIVIAPWTLRNYLLYDSFILVSTAGGQALYAGNSPETQMNRWSPLPPEISRKLKEIQHPAKADTFLREEALKYIQKNPYRSLKNYLLKFVNYFNFKNVMASGKDRSIYWTLNAVTYIPLLLIGIVGLFFYRRLDLQREELLLILLYILQGAFMAIFVTRLRYRLPYDALLLLFDAIVLTAYFKQKTLDVNRSVESS